MHLHRQTNCNDCLLALDGEASGVFGREDAEAIEEGERANAEVEDEPEEKGRRETPSEGVVGAGSASEGTESKTRRREDVMMTMRG